MKFHTCVLGSTTYTSFPLLTFTIIIIIIIITTALYRGDDKPLVRPGRKQATATEDTEFHIYCL